MKKTFAAIMLGMMLLGAGAAFANPSPNGKPDDNPKKEVSPKTSDFNIIYVEGMGVILAGTAAAAAVYSRKHE